MTDISITALGEDHFGVEVAEGENVTNHEVTVPDDLLDDLAMMEVDREELVRESFKFLLEREPATSILPSFSLDEIARYFPEYYDEIRLRMER